MDDEETLLRRARLRELIDVCFDDKDVLLLDFIEARTGKRPNQGELSAIQKDNGSKSFGDKKAKALTEQIGLVRNYFSMPLGSNLDRSKWLSATPSSESKSETITEVYKNDTPPTNTPAQDAAIDHNIRHVDFAPQTERDKHLAEINALLAQTDLPGLSIILDRAKDALHQYPLVKQTPKSSQ